MHFHCTTRGGNEERVSQHVRKKLSRKYQHFRGFRRETGSQKQSHYTDASRPKSEPNRMHLNCQSQANNSLPLFLPCHPGHPIRPHTWSKGALTIPEATDMRDRGLQWGVWEKEVWCSQEGTLSIRKDQELLCHHTRWSQLPSLLSLPSGTCFSSSVPISKSGQGHNNRPQSTALSSMSVGWALKLGRPRNPTHTTQSWPYPRRLQFPASPSSLKI